MMQPYKQFWIATVLAALATTSAFIAPHHYSVLDLAIQVPTKPFLPTKWIKTTTRLVQMSEASADSGSSESKGFLGRVCRQ